MSSANHTGLTWTGLPSLPAVVVLMLLMLVLLGNSGCRSLVLEPLESLAPRERQETITHEERRTRGRGGGDMMDDDDDVDRPSTTVVSSTRRRVVIPGRGDEGDYRGQRRRGGGRNWYLVLPADALEPFAIAGPLVLRQQQPL
ncbi:uncharacterized protein LOC142817686 isoform X2 [Rhipicephalus microplus]|uniref:uncharacterized protein LOC142817686 isoform X2 n=1 Tax=Rhipicephalus microplus TaxID=6941 RepID=UPI003F6BD451